jgi:hypothetical protein
MQAAEAGEGASVMSTPHPAHSGQQEGKRRKDAAHSLLETTRARWVRRGRRALLAHLLEHGIGTADDVADSLGETPTEIDPRWLGAVPKALAQSGIIRCIDHVQSRRPSRHASTIKLWELASEGHALTWLTFHPEIPEPEGDAGAPCPESPHSPPSPASIAPQPTLF